MFEGFERVQIETTGATINLVKGGKGPPVLLLHGYPQTHVLWHKVAPQLAGSSWEHIRELSYEGRGG